MTTARWLCIGALAAIAVAARLATAPGQATSHFLDAPASAPAQTPLDRPQVTHHAIRVGGREIRYAATAGRLKTTGEAGKPQAEIFFVAYTLDGQESQRRPVAFCFNGGPGAASVYLHLGGLSPKRCLLGQDGLALSRQFRLLDNEQTWLDFTDLVFIDPVGTGYSRPAAGVKPEQFYSLAGDVASLGEFIRLYVTRYGRWLSPKLLVGESYGTTRAVGLAGHLRDRFGMYVDGLVLLSSSLNFHSLIFAPGNDLPFALYVPSYAAAAWQHRRLDRQLLRKNLPSLLEEVGQWALKEYLPALAEGDALETAQRKAIAGRLAYYTGLPSGAILKSNLRISSFDFRQSLLVDQQLRLGLYDSRVVAEALPEEPHGRLLDPALALVVGPYVACMQSYVRSQLGYDDNQPYDFLSAEINRSWDWSAGKMGYLNVSQALQEAIIADPNLRVFVASGYYDLATGYFTQQYTINHLGLSARQRSAITFGHYAAGHMIYTSTPALKRLTEDARSFVQGLPGQE